MSVVVSGRYLHIPGGILAPTEVRRPLIAALAELARRTKRLVVCYSIGEQDRLLFEEEGWEVSKFGEETSLKLRAIHWSGKAYEWVRRQSNYCQRAGLACREVPRDGGEGGIFVQRVFGHDFVFQKPRHGCLPHVVCEFSPIQLRKRIRQDGGQNGFPRFF